MITLTFKKYKKYMMWPKDIFKLFLILEKFGELLVALEHIQKTPHPILDFFLEDSGKHVIWNHHDVRTIKFWNVFLLCIRNSSATNKGGLLKS